MIPMPEALTQAPSKQEIEQMIDRLGMAWADQFSQNLMLTVRALQDLHTAFGGKFTGRDITQL
jgi:hypothetical protein